jgi:hypothetical protein
VGFKQNQSFTIEYSDKLLEDAKCIAVVPSMVRIAITVTGGSWGLLLGGEAVGR